MLILSVYTDDALSLAQAFWGRVIPAERLASMAYHESRFDPHARNPVSTACGMMQIIRKWHPGVDCYNVSSAVHAVEQDLLFWDGFGEPIARYNEGRRLTGRGRRYARKVKETEADFGRCQEFVARYWVDSSGLLGLDEAWLPALSNLQGSLREPYDVPLSDTWSASDEAQTGDGAL